MDWFENHNPKCDANARASTISLILQIVELKTIVKGMCPLDWYLAENVTFSVLLRSLKVDLLT